MKIRSEREKENIVHTKSSGSRKGIAPPSYGFSFLDHLAVQRKENKTGMPDKLKVGIESLSGMDMSDVQVHHNSSRPAQLSALAYAQGNQIHLAPGQAKHLPHEAWHVVQQKQGRVTPAMQAKGTLINDDRGLEKEADVMGRKALNFTFSLQKRSLKALDNNRAGGLSIQLKKPEALEYIRVNQLTDYFNEIGIKYRSQITQEAVTKYVKDETNDLIHRQGLLDEWNRGHDSKSRFFIDYTIPVPAKTKKKSDKAVKSPAVAPATPRKGPPPNLFTPESPLGLGFAPKKIITGESSLSLSLQSGETVVVHGSTLAARAQQYATYHLQGAPYSPLKTSSTSALRKKFPKSVIPPSVHNVENARDIVKLANQQLRYSAAPKSSITTDVGTEDYYRLVKRFHNTNLLVSRFGSTDAPAYDEIVASVSDEHSFASGVLSVIEEWDDSSLTLTDKERKAISDLIGILQSETNRGLVAPIELRKALILLRDNHITLEQAIGSNEKSLFWAAAKSGGAKAIRDITLAKKEIKLAASKLNVKYFEQRLSGKTFKDKPEALDALRTEEARVRDPVTVEGKISEDVRSKILSVLKELNYHKESDQNERKELCKQVAEDDFKDKRGKVVTAEDIGRIADKAFPLPGK